MGGKTLRSFLVDRMFWNSGLELEYLFLYLFCLFSVVVGCVVNCWGFGLFDTLKIKIQKFSERRNWNATQKEVQKEIKNTKKKFNKAYKICWTKIKINTKYS